MSMIRKQIYLPEKLNKKLKSEALKEGVAEAEIIRRRLEKSYDSDVAQKQKLKKLIGLYESGVKTGSTQADSELYG